MGQKNLTIKRKLSLGFGLLAAIVLMVAAFALYALDAGNDRFISYIDGIGARADAASQVRSAVDRRAIAARNLVLVTQPQDLALEKAEVFKAHDEVQTTLKRLIELAKDATDISDGARKLVDEIVSVESRYGPVATSIVALALAGQKDEAIAKMNAECRPLLAALVKATDAYAGATRERQSDFVKHIETNYETQRTLLIVIAVAAVAVALFGGMLITRAITVPLEQAVTLAQTVARGHLDTAIEVRSNDETGKLLRALSDMNTRLVEIVSRVRNSSGTIASASEDIARGNADLSKRTEEQAASVEETAASMEQLTVAVRQSSDNARQANALARDAADIAESGSAAVNRVVTTMQGISASSAKIADITGIIESIAFQTNILALNAAVEAARAGEQGRGFAVVASEVRSLAQRSSSAAKEIKTLITRSLDQVRDGEALAGDAGRQMASVTMAVGRVTGIVSDIASASEEQSRGIEQVEQAISQIDQVTQQNASLVEEAAHASRAMHEESQLLNEAVSFFRLPNQAAPVAHAGLVGHTATTPRLLVPSRTTRAAIAA